MIKKFSSPKIKIWFEPMFFSWFFCGFERCGSATFPNTWRAEHQKGNVLSIFKKNFTPAKSKKQETFFFGVAEALRGSGGTIRAYDLVSSHHARGACDIICFENRFELGTINTPIQNSTALKKPIRSVLVPLKGIEPSSLP